MFEYLCAPFVFFGSAILANAIRRLMGKEVNYPKEHERVQSAISEYLDTIEGRTDAQQ